MKIKGDSIDDIVVIEPEIHRDNRGYFMEIYHQKRYLEAGLNKDFVQDNISSSVRGTLRGLHFQIKHPQAKLVQVVSGEIFDVAVDLRSGSPTFGKWTGVHLSEQNRLQFFIPEGFAHGFCVLSDKAVFLYKCSDFYAPDDEGGIIWSDSEIGIPWPVETPVISEKDKNLPTLSSLGPDQLPVL